jgi:prefoldin subunit 5
MTKATLQDLSKTEAFNVKLKEQAEELQVRIDQLQAQMESLKKVDLTIEKKKRERTNR